MITALLEFLKGCGIKQISVTGIVAFLLGVGVVGFAGDKRYQLKSEAQQMQTFQEDKLKVEILMLKLKSDGLTQEAIDKRIQEEYQAILDKMQGGTE